MLGNNQEFRNTKPRSEGEAHLQGKRVNPLRSGANYNPKNDLKSSHSRYDKGMELYKSGRVSIGSNGLFKVSGFEVDTENMQCECPDYRTRKETCKHLFAAMLFIKNRGKQSIEHLNGFSNGSNGARSESETKGASNKHQESNSKDFNRQSTITRLAVLNTATEILKTHRKPIEFNDIISLASQLEKWALGE
ncbi:MAG: hypothetical protein ACM3SR_04875 [Ignavibacteriales bacterium]